MIDKLLKKKGAFAVFPVAFGLLWTFAEPLGFSLGLPATQTPSFDTI
jgi:hypothetical protein